MLVTGVIIQTFTECIFIHLNARLRQHSLPLLLANRIKWITPFDECALQRNKASDELVQMPEPSLLAYTKYGCS